MQHFPAAALLRIGCGFGLEEVHVPFDAEPVGVARFSMCHMQRLYPEVPPGDPTSEVGNGLRLFPLCHWKS